MYNDANKEFYMQYFYCLSHWDAQNNVVYIREETIRLLAGLALTHFKNFGNAEMGAIWFLQDLGSIVDVNITISIRMFQVKSV